MMPSLKLEWIFFSVIFLLFWVLLLFSLDDYGVTWDEAETNFPAARNQAAWWSEFMTSGRGLDAESIRQHFQTESDHPSLPRTLMALSSLVVDHGPGNWFGMRLPTTFISAICCAGVGLIALRRFGWIAGVTTPFFLFLHPRWFAHSHFAAYDLMISAAWCLAAFLFYHGLCSATTKDRLNQSIWMLFASMGTGLAFAIKVHAFFIPFPLILWAILFRKWKVLVWISLCAVVVPLIYILTQPYLWWDTISRIHNRFTDYQQKVPIPVQYLGKQYNGNLPWHYPIIMLLATTPPVMTFFAISGLIAPFLLDRNKPNEERYGFWTFLLFNLITPIVLFMWKSPYDGIRLFLPVLPFMAVLAGFGTQAMVQELKKQSPYLNHGIMVAILFLITALPAGIACYQTHPFQLSYYSSLVGGIRGANRIGLESTYWGEALTPEFAQKIGEILPQGATILPLALEPRILQEYQTAGVLPKSLVFTPTEAPHYYLIQFRQGFWGQYEKALIDSDLPVLMEQNLQEVPLLRLYQSR